ncbi:MAG: flagellar biosynthetic protein FliO [Anaerocolumna sp.]
MAILSGNLSDDNSVLQVVGLLLVFIIILVVTYYTTKFVAGVKMGVTKNSNFKVLETYRLSQTKYLQLIQIGTRYFVIAVSKDHVEFLAELNEGDIFMEDRNLQPSSNFKDIIFNAINKQKEKNKNTDENSQE